MTFGETIVIGITISFTTALLTWLGQFIVAYLQQRNDKIRFFREKIIDRYSEFVAVGSADITRAKMQYAGVQISLKDQDCMELAKLDDKRRLNRFDLFRLALQIKLFEQDKKLIGKIQELTETQPFMMTLLPPRLEDSKYQERLDRFQSDIDLFEQNLSELVSMIITKHSKDVQNFLFPICWNKLMVSIQKFSLRRLG